MDEQRNIIQIGTLGPSGTSSEAAAAYFIQTDEKNPKSYSITLLNSFRSVLQGLIHGELSMALVPHAYNDINLFYINPKVALYRMFTYDSHRYISFVRLGDNKSRTITISGFSKTYNTTGGG